jgi:hypothetical protein
MSDWIPISHPPKNNWTVLFCDEYGRISLGFWSTSQNRAIPVALLSTITHWMPLPDPPKEEETK